MTHPEATADFTSDEAAILESLDIQAEPQAPVVEEVQPAPSDGQTSEQRTEAIEQEIEQPGAPAAQPAATPPPQPPTGGDPRAALRASRRAEARVRDELARVKAERDALLAKVPPEQQPTTEITDAEIAAVERDFPVVGKAARFVKQAQEAQAAQVAAKPREFVPEVLPLEVQLVVDEVPQLEAWRLDPDQTHYQRAKAVDLELSKNPAWAGKPLEDRFKEVVRLVSQAPQAPARRDPQEVLDSIPRRTPETLSHIGGGGGKAPEPSNVARYRSMTEEQIMADLALGE